MKILMGALLLFLLCLSVIACEDLFFTHTIRIEHSEDLQYTDLLQFSERRVYYIKNARLEYADFTNANKEIVLDVDKLHASPVLSCAVIQQEAGLRECPWAMGAVYPHDSIKNSLELVPYTKAEAAKFLLDFFDKRNTMIPINIKKLYNTLDKRLEHSPLDFNKVYSYIQGGTLSYWAFDGKDKIHVPFKQGNTHWRSTSFWIDDISPDSSSLELYEGIWKFFLDDKIATIYVDKKPEVSFVGFD